MFGWEFPPFNSGGLGVACEGITKSLSSSGVDLTFVLPFKMKKNPPWCKFVSATESEDYISEKEIKEMFAGYTSHSVDSENGKFVSSGNLLSGSLLSRVKSYGLKAPAIAKKYNHSIIHAHDWLTFPAGIMAKKTSGKPFVAHIHATEFDRSGSDNVNREIFEIEKDGFREADLVVAVSERTKKKVSEKYNINPNKIKVVHNGIDFNKNNSDIDHNLEILKKDGNQIVLFVGRITLQKGPDYFVEMAKKVLEYEPKTYFVVSGSGDMEGRMIEMVAKNGLSKNFIFCGFLRDKDLERIYRAGDIFVMPSVSEPFGLVPLEAMISEVPVLVSKESGVSEVISTALKSHFWDIDDMADKVVAVLRNKKLKNHLSLNGREEVKEIHWKKATDKLISLYGKLVSEFKYNYSPVYIEAI